MSLISRKEDFQSKRMWSFIGKTQRALQAKPVFEGNAGYRLMASDIAREASVSHNYETMTVAEYRQLLATHTDEMITLYNRLKNHQISNMNYIWVFMTRMVIWNVKVLRNQRWLVIIIFQI